MSPINEDSLRSCIAQNGAMLSQGADGDLTITTPSASWSYATIIDIADSAEGELAIDRNGILVEIEYDSLSGRAGLFLSSSDGSEALSNEITVSGPSSSGTAILVSTHPAANAICIRSSDNGAATLRILTIRAFVQRNIDVTPIIGDILPTLLVSPGERSLRAIAEAVSARNGEPFCPQEIGRISCRQVPLAISLADCFESTPYGKVLLEETETICSFLDHYDPDKMGPKKSFAGRSYFQKYLRQSVIRVHYTIELLRELGITGGTLLDVGSLFGNFSAPLRKLGYEVTAVDRYLIYDGAMPAHMDYLRSIGVRIVETSPQNEQEIMESLGQFDAVINMAVIEHIPNTPRLFMEMLARKVRPGGALIIDTPNITRYWNRNMLSRDLSVHYDIAEQFNCDPPFEGHHREFTLRELSWMMQQVGCDRICGRRFDYNLFQFPELSREHVDALMAMTIDPTQTDTIMVGGLVGAQLALIV